MIEEIQKLSNEAAVKALSIVARQWLSNRGLEAYTVIEGARRGDPASYQAIPDWASSQPSSNSDSANFSRHMLIVLSESEDDEVRNWTSKALEEITGAEGQILDPLTLSIAGAILIGAILAARVKKIGSSEFYEGIPTELANVIKAGTAIHPLFPNT
jgi:hypothetical protein